MVGLKGLRRKTEKASKKLAEKTSFVFKWKRSGNTRRYDAMEHDSLADRPLLKDKRVKKKKKKTQALVEKNEWDDVVAASATYGGPTRTGENSIGKFAASTAIIANTFSDETKSTQSSNHELYQPNYQENEVRVVHPVVCKRDIYLETEIEVKTQPKKASSTKPPLPIPMTMHPNDICKKVPSKPADIQAGGLPPLSVSGSMLCSNIEKGKLKAGETKARKKIMSPPRPQTLPPNTIMASMVYRALEYEERSQARESKKEQLLLLEGDKQDDIIPRKIVSAYEEDEDDGDDEEDDSSSVPKNIKERDSCAQSSVSSVTMYSTYNPDPMVRASRNLLDILRSNRFEEFAGDHMTTLYEA